MAGMRKAFVLLICLVLSASIASAQAFSGRARIDPGRTLAVDLRGGGLALDVHLSQPVPYRVYTLADPPRLVVEFREVVFDGLKAEALTSADGFEAAAMGQAPGGWSQLALRLSGPFAVVSAGMVTGADDAAPTDSATVEIRLQEVDEATFRAAAGPPFKPEGPKIQVSERPEPRDPAAPRIIVLDPGHGGIDSGAVAGNVKEADLILQFARELKEALLRTGSFEVTLTRDEDIFVPLETRVAIAHQTGADLFISLHADTLSEGNASGSTIYTLSDTATDEASEKLAERHDRQDMLLGVDLSNQDDTIAQVLIDLARLENTPRSNHLADTLIRSIEEQIGRVNSKPRRQAGFSVLKSPDIPSVLLELGFMSSNRDLKDLVSPEWRAKMVDALRIGLQDWVLEDAANQELLRN